MNLRYIANGPNPELRAKRYIDYVARIKTDWGKTAIEHFMLPASSVRTETPSYKAFQSMKRKFPKRNWLQASRKHIKGIWTMAGQVRKGPDVR